jgi:signal transduction histidine kinase/ActR/RegA family two-component response regulator
VPPVALLVIALGVLLAGAIVALRMRALRAETAARAALEREAAARQEVEPLRLAEAEARRAAEALASKLEAVAAERRADERAFHSQKMEGIGRLAGGVAHDFNNLLTGILGFVELAEQAKGMPADTRAHLQNARSAAQNAATLTRQLLAFARKQVIAPEVMDLNSVVHEGQRLLRRVLGDSTEVVLALDPDLWPVLVDRSQIEQTLMNLAANARDAMPTGGRLVIESRNVSFPAPPAHLPVDVPPGEYVELTVADTGAGMEERARRHAFEPFFTTKAAGKGTGLGLAMTHGIVGQHGGYVWLHSEPGRGTAVTMLLPRASAGLQAVAAAPVTTPTLAAGSGETVLVVEDEAIVRSLAVESLQMAGYTILQAGSATEALALARVHRGPIHLLLTDVVMPHMNGMQLAEELTQVRPETKVLFTSGFSENAISEDGLLRPRLAFLPKPYTPSSIARAVREMLDSDVG